LDIQTWFVQGGRHEISSAYQFPVTYKNSSCEFLL